MMTKYEKEYYQSKKSNLDTLTLLQMSLFNNNLDATVTLGDKVTLEVEDIDTGSIVCIVTADSLEQAYADLLGRCVGSVRDAKTGRYKGLSRL